MAKRCCRQEWLARSRRGNGVDVGDHDVGPVAVAAVEGVGRGSAGCAVAAAASAVADVAR